MTLCLNGPKVTIVQPRMHAVDPREKEQKNAQRGAAKICSTAEGGALEMRIQWSVVSFSPVALLAHGSTRGSGGSGSARRSSGRRSARGGGARTRSGGRCGSARCGSTRRQRAHVGHAGHLRRDGGRAARLRAHARRRGQAASSGAGAGHAAAASARVLLLVLVLLRLLLVLLVLLLILGSIVHALRQINQSITQTHADTRRHSEHAEKRECTSRVAGSSARRTSRCWIALSPR